MQRTKQLVRTLLAVLAAACATPVLAWTQAAPPVTHILVARAAAVVLDSLATEARAARVETAGCVTSYAVRDSVITIEAISKATYDHADSVSIWTKAPMCAEGVPTIHSHMGVELEEDRPSPVDRLTALKSGMWAFLLSVPDNGWFLRIYSR